MFITSNLCKYSLGRREGVFYRLKRGRASLNNMKYNINNGKLHQSLTFLLKHKLTNDISYDTKLNR